MSRSKKLYALLAVLAAVCVATFAVSRIEEHKENIKNSDEVILAIDSDTVQQVSWECESGSYEFTKDDIWTYDDDADFPVSEDKIEELLDVFSEFGVSFVIEDVDDYSQYGLDDPVCTINIATDDTEYEIKMGDYSTMDEKRYVSTGDGNVYLAAVDPVDSYDVEISALIDNDDTPSYDEVQNIAFKGNEDAADGNMTDYEVTYSEDGGDSYRDTDVYFTTADGVTVPLDTSDVNSYARTLSYLDLTDYVTYKATDEDLATYGLLDPELTVTMTYTKAADSDDANDEADGADASDEASSGGAENTQTFVISVSRDPAELAAAALETSEDDTSTEDASSDDTDSDTSSSSEEEDFNAYLRVAESPIIYRITKDEYNDLMAYTYYDLRHDEILPADTDDMTQIDITLEGSEYTITANEEDDVIVWYRGDTKIESDDLIDALEALSADSFTTEEATGKEEISIKVHMSTDGDTDGSEAATEGTDDTEMADDTVSSGDTVQITFYRYDGNDCLAVIDGKPAALVARSQVVDLIEAVNAIVLN